MSGDLTRRRLLSMAHHAATAPPRAVEWEAGALDAAVFSAVRAAELAGDQSVAHAYSAAMEDAYVAGTGLARRLHADRVNAAFAAQLGLTQTLIGAIDGHPRLASEARRVFVERARSLDAEEANLRDLPDGRAVLLTLMPERFGDLESLVRFLAHELAHLDDLLDPAFGREAAFDWPGPTKSEAVLQRRRYRALWCLSVDARLRARGEAKTTGAERRSALETAFRRVPAPILDAIAATLGSGCPSHARLLAAAADPRALRALVPPGQPAADLAELATAPHRSSCPLCGFPTIEWGRTADWTPVMAAAARTRSPGWDPAQGACERCRECWELRAPQLGAGDRA